MVRLALALAAVGALANAAPQNVPYPPPTAGTGKEPTAGSGQGPA